MKTRIKRWIAVIFLLLEVVVLPKHVMAQRPLGIDVSSYQGSADNPATNIIWTSVKSAGISFAWAKATESTNITDADFVTNELGAKSASVLIGAYHFAHPEINPGIAGADAEAAYFWSVAGPYIVADGGHLAPALDYQTVPGGAESSSAAWAYEWCQDIISYAAANGVVAQPVIYTSEPFATSWLDSSDTGSGLWIASQNGQNPLSGSPGTTTPWTTWNFWQYGQSTNVAGVEGAVDEDVFNGTSTTLTNFVIYTRESYASQNFFISTNIDISKFSGNETDPAIAVNPNSATNLFVAGVSDATNGLFTTYTSNLTTWSSTVIASSTSSNLVPAYGEPSVAWDSNTNLFLAYLPASFQGIAIAVSTNGGKTFFPWTNLVPNDVTDQPRITAGVAGTATNSVWLVYKDYSLTGTPLVVQSLQTTGIGSNGIGPFSSAEVIPGSAAGAFPDIAIGPSNEVMVAYQNNINSSSTAQVFVSINTNTLLTNGFGTASTVTSDAVGGFTYIPAEESANGINAGVGVAWDQNPTSPFYGRAYLVYTSVGSSGVPSMNISSRYSVNGGKTWSSELQVNDDLNNKSHFFPRMALDPVTGSVAVCWYDCRNDTGASANKIITVVATGMTNVYTNMFDLDGAPNDDFMVYETASLSGGTSFANNQPAIPIWTYASLVLAMPPAGAFTYVSETALANSANGVGHHIAMAYASGNIYPVWADNSDFLPANPGPAMDFDFYMGYSVLPTANLGISVSNFPAQPTSDEIIAYYVIVTNYGPFAATNIFITNTLSTNLAFVGVSPANGESYTIANNGQTIIFHYANANTALAVGASVTNLIRVTAVQSGYSTNIASVIGTLPNAFPANAYATNTLLINAEDLALTMSASPTNVDISSQVTYTLTVTNLGPAGNGLVYITNTFPSNLTQITNVVQSQGTYYVSSNVIVFSLGTLGSNQSTTVSFSATALSAGSQFQNATNIAVVTSTDFDTNLLNNYATNVVTILGEDLGVTISASATDVNIGDTITYTVNVTNFGPSSSGIVTLTNILSSNLGQISLIQLPPGSGSVSKNVIAFNMGELGANQGITIVYTAVALSVNATATNAISSVTVSSTDFDTNLVNNYATNVVTINGEDLALGLSQSVAIVPDGQPITYTDYVTNLGPSMTGVINVTNILSTNLSALTVVQSPGSYTINGNMVVFQLGTFSAGQTATLVFTAIPTSPGMATNSAAVGSTDFDTNLLNNSAQVIATVVVPSSLVTNFSVTAFPSAAALVWDTPYNTTAQVAYGLTSIYGSISSLSAPATHHVILLTGLVRNTNYYFNAMCWGQGVYYSTNGSFATVDSLILNTINASFSGSWLQGSPAITGFYGSYFNVANTTPYNPTASATYTPMIPSSGYYNVSVWYPQSTNFTTNAQMFVAGATNEILATVNQTTNGGSWQPLATNLYFASGTSGDVIIYNDTGESNKLVAANAMMWSYNNSQDYPSNGIPPAWWSTFYFGTNTAAANSNFAAYVFGTPPYDPADTPDFWLSFPASNTVMVSFAPYQGGRTYLLQTATNLSNPQWLTLTNQPVISTNAAGIFTNGTGYGVFTITQTNTAPYFFRLSAQLIPE